MINLKKMTRTELINFVHTLGYDSRFGMWQRDYAVHAIRGKSGHVAFIDIDDLKVLNTRHGYQACDERVKSSFATLTNNPSYVVFRWFSGDEIVVFSATGIQLSELTKVHKKLSFTAAIAPVAPDTLLDVINKLSLTVLRWKGTFQKGTIKEVN